MIDKLKNLKIMLNHFPSWMDIKKRYNKSIGGAVLQSYNDEIDNTNLAIKEYQDLFFWCAKLHLYILRFDNGGWCIQLTSDMKSAILIRLKNVFAVFWAEREILFLKVRLFFWGLTVTGSQDGLQLIFLLSRAYWELLCSSV